jgi:hypothetical protein
MPCDRRRSPAGAIDRRAVWSPLEPLLLHALADVVLLPLGTLIGVPRGELHLFGGLRLASKASSQPRLCWAQPHTSDSRADRAMGSFHMVTRPWSFPEAVGTAGASSSTSCTSRR